MLRIASNEEYSNLKEHYLQCIAFAHNCTYSSVIECTPFEAGHGLRARTVAEARMAIPKLQLLEEDADDSFTAQAWDKSLPKKVLELAARMATRQWLRLILNGIVGWQAKSSTKLIARSMIANCNLGWRSISINLHLSKKSLPRDARLSTLLTIMVLRPWQQSRAGVSLSYNTRGRLFNRDISLVIPPKEFGSLDEDSFNPVTTETVATPSLHVKGEIPKEGELVIIKDSSAKGWFLSEVLRVLPNLVEVRYFTTPTPPLENYERCSVHKRSERLSEICFRRTYLACPFRQACRKGDLQAALSEQRRLASLERSAKHLRSGRRAPHLQR
jgi:hypothetical protein